MSPTPNPLLEVLSIPDDGCAEPLGGLRELWEEYQRHRDRGQSALTSAVLVATRVDRLGFAFGVGYPAALERLVSVRGLAHQLEIPAALCVTEAGGNGPRAIETTLTAERDGTERLNGTKTFVTFGSEAKTLLVAAKVGDKRDGRPDLAMVLLPAGRPGVTLDEIPQAPFVPEVPHTGVTFTDVEVNPIERLPGDGYLDYVKPFRTVEDIHVLGATIGYLIGLLRRVGHANPELTDPVALLTAELAATLLALDGLATAPPLDARTHIALHGVYRGLERLLRADGWRAILAAAPDDERARWERDRVLLEVAKKAREARFAAARRATGLGYAAD